MRVFNKILRTSLPALLVACAISAFAAVDNTVWVPATNGDALVLIDKTNLSTTEISLDHPTAVAVDNQYVWVLNSAKDLLTRINKQSNLSKKNVSTGKSPAAVAVDGTHVWVVNSEDHALMKIERETLSIEATIETGAAPRAVAVDRTYVWVANAGDNTVYRILKTDTAEVEKIATGKRPQAIAMNAASVYVVNYFDHTLTVIQKEDLSTQTLKVGQNPVAIAVDAENVWIANWLDNTVTRIEMISGNSENITVGSHPSGISVDRNYVWVTNEDNDTVTRIDKVDITATRSIEVSAKPNGFGDMTGYAYDLFFSSALEDTTVFMGTYRGEQSIGNCANTAITLIFGSDSERKNERNYIYLPADSLDATYSGTTEDKGSYERNITIDGDTITLNEEGRWQNDSGRKWRQNIVYAFSNYYNDITISGTYSDEEEAAACQGAVAGTAENTHPNPDGSGGTGTDAGGANLDGGDCFIMTLIKSAP